MITLREPRQPVELHALAREAGLHPDLVGRLVRLGALDSPGARLAGPRFGPDAAARLARVMRLRRDLSLNLAGALLACELLDRIGVLEQRLRHSESHDNRSR
jgi:hypothetical protein